MVRYEIAGDSNISNIIVSYGSDLMAGVFLSVSDARLEYDEAASDEVNYITEHIGVGDGSYFDLRTGETGFGMRVDEETMATYMRRFGVPKEHITTLLPRRQVHSQGKNKKNVLGCCRQCDQGQGMRCGKCHVVRYCSRECQREDWPTHRLFCDLQPVSMIGAGHDDVQALLLPESSDSPRFVRLPQHWEKDVQDDDDPGLWSVDCKEFITGRTGVTRSEFFPPTWCWKNYYELRYKEDFLLDGSCRENMSFGRISEGKLERSYWRGNVLILKARDGGLDTKYESMSLSDIRAAICFMKAYGALAT
jgi:hypothetical protein